MTGPFSRLRAAPDRYRASICAFTSEEGKHVIILDSKRRGIAAGLVSVSWHVRSLFHGVPNSHSVIRKLLD